MGEIYRLTDGTSSMDVSPIRGQNEPESRGRQILKGKDGKEDVHEWGGKNVWEVPLNDVSEARADLLITWWTEMTSITFTPDLPSSSGQTFEVKIAEVKRPMQMWGGDWDTLFAGMLTLYEVDSVSFSSSSQSVSGSTSCSSLSASSSCSTGSSLSCSVFLWSVSRSSSVGADVESIPSTSCSTSDSQSCSEALSISSGVSFSLISCSTSGSQSCSISYSDSSSESLGIIAVSITSQSCSNDSAGDISCSLSAGGQSCSESGAG